MRAHPRILVVEDDAAARAALVELLREDGHETVGAASGREALTVLGSWSPNVLVLDYSLPDMNGLELLAEARQSGEPRIAALLVTGQALGPRLRKWAARLGVPIFRKPLAPRAFLHQVRKLGVQRSSV